MSEPPNNSERRILPFSFPRLSSTQWLIVALVVNLVFSSYLLARLNRTNQAVKQAASAAQAFSPTATPDLYVIGTQLQEIQNKLQVSSLQLAQKGSSMGIPAAVEAAQDPLEHENLSALWAEIDQVNKIMQPLMAQLEAAVTTQSSRSPSEVIALRTRVNTLHQRLAYLMARVEALQARSNIGTASPNVQGSSHPATPCYSNNPNAAEYQQLYQNMLQMQQMLQQIQQGITP